MRPTLLFLVLAVALAPAAVADAPWFPLKKGNVWTYEVTTSATVPGLPPIVKKGTATMRVVKTEQVLGKTYYVLEVRGTGDSVDDGRFVARQTGDTVEIYSASNAHLILLPGNLGGGKTGALSVKVAGNAVDITGHKVGKAEKITVPNATFEAVPVSAKVTVSATVTVQSTVHYARGAGPIRMVMTTTTGGVAAKRTLALKTATLGATVMKAPDLPEVTDPVKPPKATPGKKGALAKLIASAARSDAAATTALLARAKAVQDRAKALAGSAPGASADGLTRVVKAGDHEVEGARFDDRLVIVDGDFTTAGAVRNCVLIVNGDIDIAALCKGCVVLCTGEIDVGSYLKESTVYASEISVGSYLKDSVVEAGDVSVGAYTKGNVYINTARPDGARSKDDRDVKDASGLRQAASSK